MPSFTAADRVGAIGGYIGGIKGIGQLFGPNGLGSLFGWENGAAPEAVALRGGGYCTRHEIGYVQQLANKDATIAYFAGNKYTDEKVSCLEREVCDLKAALTMEVERRSCGDQALKCYVDGNFVPGQLVLPSRRVNYNAGEPVVQLRDHCCHPHDTTDTPTEP